MISSSALQWSTLWAPRFIFELMVVTHWTFFPKNLTKRPLKQHLIPDILIESYSLWSNWNSSVLATKFLLQILQENSKQYSRFYLTIYSQYLNLILGNLCTNLFCSAGNFFYLAFTLSRYVAVTDTKNKYLSNCFHRFAYFNSSQCSRLFSISDRIHRNNTRTAASIVYRKNVWLLNRVFRWLQREFRLKYRVHCRKCGPILANDILWFDSYRCVDCDRRGFAIFHKT